MVTVRLVQLFVGYYTLPITEEEILIQHTIFLLKLCVCVMLSLPILEAVLKVSAVGPPIRPPQSPSGKKIFKGPPVSQEKDFGFGELLRVYFPVVLA